MYVQLCQTRKHHMIQFQKMLLFIIKKIDYVRKIKIQEIILKLKNTVYHKK